PCDSNLFPAGSLPTFYERETITRYTGSEHSRELAFVLDQLARLQIAHPGSREVQYTLDEHTGLYRVYRPSHAEANLFWRTARNLLYRSLGSTSELAENTIRGIEIEHDSAFRYGTERHAPARESFAELQQRVIEVRRAGSPNLAALEGELGTARR